MHAAPLPAAPSTSRAVYAPLTEALLAKVPGAGCGSGRHTRVKKELANMLGGKLTEGCTVFPGVDPVTGTRSQPSSYIPVGVHSILPAHLHVRLMGRACR